VNVAMKAIYVEFDNELAVAQYFQEVAMLGMLQHPTPQALHGCTRFESSPHALIITPLMNQSV
jgi:hypothetical protein